MSAAPQRSDHAIISGLIEPNTKVLDIGCGDGDLLEWLAVNKNVDARGIEIVGPKVQRAIARGVSVYQGDVHQGLVDYPEDAFDFAILSQTLQETRLPLKVLGEMLRVSRHAIVAFPNFGHWTVRLSHLWSGGAPQTDLFPHDWYDSPNIHFLTIHDFEALIKKQGWMVERRIFLTKNREVKAVPNLLAETAIFQIRK